MTEGIEKLNVLYREKCAEITVLKKERFDLKVKLEHEKDSLVASQYFKIQNRVGVMDSDIKSLEDVAQGVFEAREELLNLLTKTKRG